MQLLGVSSLLVTATLLAPTDAHADFGRLKAITPASQTVYAFAQTTNGRGVTTYLYEADDAFFLRTRLANGRLRTPVRVASLGASFLTDGGSVALNDRGQGIVVWNQLDEFGGGGQLWGRRFTTAGHLGRLETMSPPGPSGNFGATVPQLMVFPSGPAVVTWGWGQGRGEHGYVRVIERNGHRKPIRKVGPGLDVGAAFIALRSRTRAMLVWTNDNLQARYIRRNGTLTARHIVAGSSFVRVGGGLTDLGIDRRGIATLGCVMYSKNTAPPPLPSNSYRRACIVRVSPRLRMLGRLQVVSARHVYENLIATRVSVSPDGRAVVGWSFSQVPYPTWGAQVRPVHPDGGLGRIRTVSNGYLGAVAMGAHGNGYVVSTGVASDGFRRIIKVTPVRRGAIGRTVRVARSDADDADNYLKVAMQPRRRALVTFVHALAPGTIFSLTGR
jgi:hypothetical protein